MTVLWVSESTTKELRRAAMTAAMSSSLGRVCCFSGATRDFCSKPETTTTTPVTKRDILHYISSIFDPLGLITPVTITAKLLLQDFWQDNVCSLGH